MVDSKLLPIAGGFLNRGADYLNSKRISANTVTAIGFFVGLLAVPFIIAEYFMIENLLICINRICDGLDGIIARLNKITNKGAFLDISLDFIFYGSIPVAFAFLNPLENS